MKLKTTSGLSVLMLCALFGAVGFSGTQVSAEEMTQPTTTVSPDIAKMQQTVALLTRVIDLLDQKAALMGISVAEHDSDADVESDVLKVWVEVHGYATHAHVLKPHQPLDAFFIDPMYTDKEAVIAAIAAKTGLSTKDIAAVITFPTLGLNDKGNSIEEDTTPAAAHDVTQIHIMNNGMIMWGDGSEVSGATITVDNKVKLSDGTIVTPAADLR